MPRLRFLPFALLVLAGCDGGSAAPRTAKPIDDGPAEEALPPIQAPKPAKSDPAAALAVNAILLAHTENEPSRLDRLRKVRILRKGDWKIPDGSRSDATMEIAIWGDQYRTTFAIAATGNVPETFSLNRAQGWRYQSKLSAKPIPLDIAALEAILPEVNGDRMTLLTPLTSDKLVAAIVRDGKDGGETILRVWLGDDPPILLHVDAKSNRLLRLTYEMLENGQTVARALRLSELAPVAGVLLPGRVEYGVGPLTFTTWSKIEYQVPGQFELSFFEKP